MQGISSLLKSGAEKSLLASGQYKLIDDEEHAKRDTETFNSSKGSLDKIDGYSCSVCLDKGWIMDYWFADVGYWATYVRPCPCVAHRQTMKDKKKSGLNVSGKYTFDNYRTNDQWQKDIKAQAISFLDELENGVWFFIGGQSGAGKTHICTAIADACIDQGRRAKYMIWGEDFKRIKGLIASDPEKYQAAMKELGTVPVLLIDDLFKGGKDERGHFRPPTEADIKGAFDIINARYNDPKSITIINSERMMTDILDLDSAIGGRIAERAKDYIINLPPNNKLNYRISKMDCSRRNRQRNKSPVVE